MQLQLALICDHAEQTADGKLDVRGVFNDLAAPGFPAKHDMVLVMNVEWSRDDIGHYDFDVNLTGPSGQSTMTIQGHSEVDRREPDRPPARTQIVMPLREVVFPEPFGPSSPQITPLGTSKSKSETAVCFPKRFVTPSRRMA